MPPPDSPAVAEMPPPNRLLTVAEKPLVPPVTAKSPSLVGPTAAALSPSSVMSVPESPILLTPDTLPASFDASPDAQLVRQLLSTRVDLTLSKHLCRALYTESTVAKWNHWSNPSVPQHRDACEVLVSFFCFILIHFFHLPFLVPFSVVSPLRFLTISLLSSLFLSPLFVPSLLFPLFPRISHSFSLFAFSDLPSDFSLFLSLCSVVPSDFSLFPCFFPFSRIPQLLHGKTEACKAFRP